jgi:hypothetical protein
MFVKARKFLPFASGCAILLLSPIKMACFGILENSPYGKQTGGAK